MNEREAIARLAEHVAMLEINSVGWMTSELQQRRQGLHFGIDQQKTREAICSLENEAHEQQKKAFAIASAMRAPIEPSEPTGWRPIGELEATLKALAPERLLVVADRVGLGSTWPASVLAASPRASAWELFCIMPELSR